MYVCIAGLGLDVGMNVAQSKKAATLTPLTQHKKDDDYSEGGRPKEGDDTTPRGQGLSSKLSKLERGVSSSPEERQGQGQRQYSPGRSWSALKKDKAL